MKTKLSVDVYAVYTNTSSGNMRIVCNKCRDAGHFAKDCPQTTMRSNI